MKLELNLPLFDTPEIDQKIKTALDAVNRTHDGEKCNMKDIEILSDKLRVMGQETKLPPEDIEMIGFNLYQKSPLEAYTQVTLANDNGNMKVISIETCLSGDQTSKEPKRLMIISHLPKTLCAIAKRLLKTEIEL